MELSHSSDANSPSEHFTELRGHYRGHKSSPLFLILRQMNSVHIVPSIFSSFSHIYLGLPSGPFLSGFPTKILYVFLSFHMCATCPANLILFNFIILIIFGGEVKFCRSTLCNNNNNIMMFIYYSPNIIKCVAN
jgi:hypothetical protein